MRTNRFFAAVTLAALASLGAFSTPAEAQLASASATTLGTAQNNTATVRGFGAISVNPAGLAMPGSGFSLAIGPVRARSGLDPITLSDFNDVAGQLIPASTKEDWLSRISANGSLAGSAGVRVTELALSAGNIGFQVSTIGSARIDLAPSIAEAVLYGNAGRTGSPADLSLQGSSAIGFAVTTAGLSFALPLSSPTGDMAIGVTGKYHIGHGVALARDQGGTITSNPIAVNVNFPTILPKEDVSGFDGGSGMGLDVGFMLKNDNISLGASVQNVISTFEWDVDKLSYRAGLASVTTGSTSTDFDEQPFASAPTNLKNEIADMTFSPALSVGLGLDVSDDLTVSGDLRNRFGDGIELGPKFHLGAGAEFRGLKVIHLRGGAAIITDGIQYSGGASLVLGPINLSAAAAVRTGDLGEEVLGQFVLSFGNR